MRRAFTLFGVLLVVACESKPETKPSEPKPLVAFPFIINTDARAPDGATDAPALEFGPADGPPEQRQARVLELLSGDKSSGSLPVVATEPGESLDPDLRSKVAPVVRGQVRFGKITMTGGMAPEIVQRIARQKLNPIKRCYESRLAQNPRLAGFVTVELIIDKDGKTRSTKLAGSDLSDPDVVTCVVRTLSELTFPEGKPGTARVPVQLALPGL